MEKENQEFAPRTHSVRRLLTTCNAADAARPSHDIHAALLWGAECLDISNAVKNEGNNI